MMRMLASRAAWRVLRRGWSGWLRVELRVIRRVGGDDMSDV